MKKVLLSLAVAVLASGCASSNSVKMDYQAQAASRFAAGAGAVTVAPFVDARGEPANWLGAIRGGYGNPLKVLETAEPVAKIVGQAFSDGVRARSGSGGAAASNRNFELRGTVRKLDCSQYVRREAHAIIDVVVVDGAGKQRLAKTYSSDVVEGSLLNLQTGIFADVEDLRGTAQKALREVVDKALDDPAFRDAIS